MSIRARNAHFTNWAKVIEALQNAGFLITDNDEDIARAFLKNAKTDDIENPFYYMVCFIKDTREIYTHGEFYNCGYDSEFEEVISTALTGLSENKQDNIEDLDTIRELSYGSVQQSNRIGLISYSDKESVYVTTFDPWTLYSFNNVTSINFMFSDTTSTNEYMMEIIVPEGATSTLSLPNVVWENGTPDLSTPGTYHINIMRGCATYAYFNKY